MTITNYLKTIEGYNWSTQCITTIMPCNDMHAHVHVYMYLYFALLERTFSEFYIKFCIVFTMAVHFIILTVLFSVSNFKFVIFACFVIYLYKNLCHIYHKSLLTNNWDIHQSSLKRKVNGIVSTIHIHSFQRSKSLNRKLVCILLTVKNHYLKFKNWFSNLWRQTKTQTGIENAATYM